MSPRSPEKFIVYNLRETYAEPGEYEFKIVLNPRFFKNSHDSDVKLVDSDGRPMRHEVRRWGRKLSCRFVIDESTPDGVASARLVLRDDRGNETPGQLIFWTVK